MVFKNLFWCYVLFILLSMVALSIIVCSHWRCEGKGIDARCWTCDWPPTENSSKGWNSACDGADERSIFLSSHRPANLLSQLPVTNRPFLSSQNWGSWLGKEDSTATFLELHLRYALLKKMQVQPLRFFRRRPLSSVYYQLGCHSYHHLVYPFGCRFPRGCDGSHNVKDVKSAAIMSI